MSHSRIGHREEVDSRLFVVGSQTGNSTPGLSFGHNLCFRCSNEPSEPILDIYAPRAFQWYKKRHKPLSLDPCNHSLKFQESTGTPSPQVGVALGVWGFTPSYSLTLFNTPGSMWCDFRASSWPTLLQCLCFDSRASFLLARNLVTPLALVASPKLGLRQNPKPFSSIVANTHKKLTSQVITWRCNVFSCSTWSCFLLFP